MKNRIVIIFASGFVSSLSCRKKRQTMAGKYPSMQEKLINIGKSIKSSEMQYEAFYDAFVNCDDPPKNNSSVS